MYIVLYHFFSCVTILRNICKPICTCTPPPAFPAAGFNPIAFREIVSVMVKVMHAGQYNLCVSLVWSEGPRVECGR